MIAERSAHQPVQLCLNYDDRPPRLRSIIWTKRWLLPSIKSRLRRLELLYIPENYVARILSQLKELLWLLDFTISLRDWDTEEFKAPPVILDTELPLSLPDQLTRVSFTNCFPPLSSPIFSTNLTHLALNACWDDPHPAVPTVADMLRLLPRLQQLEDLRLDCVPVPNPVTDGLGDHGHRTDNLPLVLPSSLRKVEYALTEYNDRVSASLAFLPSLKFPQGPDLHVEMCQDKDIELENTVFARIARVAFRTIDLSVDTPWKLSVGGSSATMVFDDGLRDWTVDPPRNLHRERLDGETRIEIDRSDGSGDVGVSNVLHELPLKHLRYLHVISPNAPQMPGVDPWTSEVASARSLRHLSITLPSLSNAIAHLMANEAAGTRLLTQLESIALKSNLDEEAIYWDASISNLILNELVAWIAARRGSSMTLRELFVDRPLQPLYTWQRFTCIHVTFVDSNT